MVPFLDKGLQWVNVKRKPFRQIQAYPGIIQAYSGIFRTLCNPGIFTTLVYSEHRYIQNAVIFKIQDIFRTLPNIYDEAFCENS